MGQERGGREGSEVFIFDLVKLFLWVLFMFEEISTQYQGKVRLKSEKINKIMQNVFKYVE